MDGLSTKERSRLLKLIVVQYVPECVRLEYRSMAQHAAKLLLDALDSMINTTHMEIIRLGLAEDLTITSAPTGKKAADPTCPIAQLLSKTAHTQINQEDVEKIKQKVSTWGDTGRSNMLNPFFLNMRDIQLEKEYNEMKNARGINSKQIGFQHSTVLATKTDASDFEWKNLLPIGVKDLKLFESCKGSVLRGTLVALPTILTGITTFIQDDQGAIVQIGLYNFVPGNMDRLSSLQYVRKHLCKGTPVKIAEPFTKIFHDGNRGIRIEDPREFCVEGGSGSDIVSAREEGNGFYRKKMYAAAIDSYSSGLQQETVVPIVLSNRAQAFIQLEKWPEALADAAASLTIRSGCEKTQLRYQKALAQILDQQGQCKGDSLCVALESTSWIKAQYSSKSFQELKSEGNEAYNRKNYNGAIVLYTSALHASNKDVRAVLSNWSQAALELECYHEALAASSASLRIWADDKGVYRLCKSLAKLSETNLAISILRCYDGAAPALSDLKSSISRYVNALAHEDTCRGLLNLTSDDVCHDFASDKIETFYHPAKGRGIRARESISNKHLVLVESPLAASNVDYKKDKYVSFTLNHNRALNDKAQSLLESIIMSRMKHDQLLSQRIENLYDGNTPCPLVSIGDLLKSVEVASAPLLLPPRPEFFPENKSPTLSAERIRNILNTNSFGSFDQNELARGKASELSKKESLLYSAISMFNHSSDPNCIILKCSGSARAVLTCRTVKKGEELSIRYHHDPEVLKKKWGLDE